MKVFEVFFNRGKNRLCMIVLVCFYLGEEGDFVFGFNCRIEGLFNILEGGGRIC